MKFVRAIFQPLFPGESGVDQLVEIIRVIYVMILFQYCWNMFVSLSPSIFGEISNTYLSIIN